MSNSSASKKKNQLKIDKFAPLENENSTLGCRFGDPTENSLLNFSIGKTSHH
jgi:hypothetical protein